MRAYFATLPASSVKLCIALVLGTVCGTTLLVSPGVRNIGSMQKAWESLGPFRSSNAADAAGLPAKEPLPSISAGTKYYAVSRNANGKDDIGFDTKVMDFMETSQARLDLLVATLESTPIRAKTCANNQDTTVCQKLYSVMTDAVTSLDQAELAIEAYQRKGIVADPVLARVQKQVKELRSVSARYPGIGPRVEP